MAFPYFETASERLDFVRQQCLIPTDTALATLASVSKTAVGLARSRGSIGKKLGGNLRNTTGVSFGWLSGDKVDPFPDGPIPYAGPVTGEQLFVIVNDLEAIRNVIAALARTVGRTKQGLGDVLHEELEAMPPKYREGPLYLLLNKELRPFLSKQRAAHVSKQSATRG